MKPPFMTVTITNWSHSLGLAASLAALNAALACGPQVAPLTTASTNACQVTEGATPDNTGSRQARVNVGPTLGRCESSTAPSNPDPCQLTQVALLGKPTAPCGKLYRDGQFYPGNMPRNSCAMEFDEGELGGLSLCLAYVLSDGSRVIDLQGGVRTLRPHSSTFKTVLIAHILTPPPRDKAQRFDIGLGCQEEKAVFQPHPGHSKDLGEVRAGTLLGKRLVEMQAQTGNDSRAVGALTFHHWSEEEVIGSVHGIDIRPDNFVKEFSMWFRLDWQTEGDLRRLTECDRYRNRNWTSDPVPYAD